MRGMWAFFGKEWQTFFRTGRWLLVLVLGVIFGVLNPATAKLTPWLMSQMASSLESSGLIVTGYTVTAMDSWVQFFKNMPMATIVLLVLYSGLFTAEYSSGTLIPLLTKGLSRAGVVAAKTGFLLLVWSGFYGLIAGLTYGYTAYYWDMSPVRHLAPALAGQWLAGVFLVCTLVFLSSFVSSAGQVMLGMGLVWGVMMLLSMWAEAAPWLPLYLTDGMTLLTGAADPADWNRAFAVTGAASLLLAAAAFPVTRFRRL